MPYLVFPGGRNRIKKIRKSHSISWGKNDFFPTLPPFRFLPIYLRMKKADDLLPTSAECEREIKNTTQLHSKQNGGSDGEGGKKWRPKPKLTAEGLMERETVRKKRIFRYATCKNDFS